MTIETADPQGRFTVGEWQVDVSGNRLTRNGQDIALEPKIMAVLELLARNAGRVISRDELIESAWAGRMVTDHAINRVITKLRRALGDTPADPGYIETVSKRGYRMIAAVGYLGVADDEPLPGRFRMPRAWLGLAVLAAALALAWALLPQPMELDDDVDLLTPRSARPLTKEAGNEMAPAVSPDGRWLAYTHRPPDAEHWQTRITDILGDRTLAVSAPEGINNNPAWSADGERLVYHHSVPDEACQILVNDFDAERFVVGEPRLLTECDPSSYDVTPVLMGNDTLLYADAPSADDPYRIYALGLSSGNREQLTSPPPTGRGDYRIARSPSGKQILVVRNFQWFGSEIYRSQWPDFELRLVTDLAWPLQDISWADEKSLLVRNQANQVTRINVQSGESRVVFTSPEHLESPRVTPDGRHLVVVSGTHSVRSIALDPLDDEFRPDDWVFEQSSVAEKLPRFAPDGERLAYVSRRDGSPQIWTASKDGSTHQITDFSRLTEITQLDWSPDGRRLLSHANGRIYSVDADSGETQWHTPVAMFARNGAWSRDGAHIYFASNHDADWQIWRVGATGGSPERVTGNGGYSAREWLDGSLLLTKFHQDGLYQFDGNSETPLIPSLSSVDWDKWFLFDETVYYPLPDQDCLTSWSSQPAERPDSTCDLAGSDVSMSPDGAWIATARHRRTESSLVLMVLDAD